MATSHPAFRLRPKPMNCQIQDLCTAYSIMKTSFLLTEINQTNMEKAKHSLDQTGHLRVGKAEQGAIPETMCQFWLG